MPTYHSLSNMEDDEHENPHLIKNAELAEYPINMDKLNKWTIPSVSSSEIYKIGVLNYFNSRLAIKTMEQTIQISSSSKTIRLFNKKDLPQYSKTINLYICVNTGCL